MRFIKPYEAGKPAPAFIPGALPWHTGPLAAYDCETTSVDPETARIVSAALVVDDPAATGPVTREWVANPGIPIPLDAVAIHGLDSDYAREHGEPPAVVLAGIVAALSQVQRDYGRIPLVLVNAPYDLTIADRELRRHGVTPGGLALELPVIDTLACDRGLLDKYRPGRRSLTAASAAYSIAIRGAHTATGDAQCAIRLARAMGAKYPAFGACDLDVLQELQAAYSAEWADGFESYRRSDGEPGFTVPRGWPLIPYRGKVTSDA